MHLIRLIRQALACLLKGLLIALITIYRYAVSPILHMLAPGSGCRFQPTCSEYALQAVQRHGAFTGSWLAVKRLARCHPWGDHGYDPVPDSCSCTAENDHQHPTPLTPSTAGKESPGNP